MPQLAARPWVPAHAEALVQRLAQATRAQPAPDLIAELDRLVEDNKPGAIKHFYVIAPKSGQVLIYSTVKGKVTSSGKRLAPRSVAVKDGKGVGADMHGIPVKIGDYTYRTGEVIEDDGTYGGSVPYVYWWDVKGVYHQHFFTDGQIIHVSSQPIPSPNGVVIQVDDTRDDAN